MQDAVSLCKSTRYLCNKKQTTWERLAHGFETRVKQGKLCFGTLLSATYPWQNAGPGMLQVKEYS